MNTSMQKYSNIQFQTPINISAPNTNTCSAPDDSELYPLSFDSFFENKSTSQTSYGGKDRLVAPLIASHLLHHVLIFHCMRKPL